METDRNVASYVDRILKGARPARRAGAASLALRAGRQPEDGKALGLVLSPMFIARVDEVIE
jgi:hypothetical protein